ncbi:hypothetical protein BST25_21930 [Mycobacterium heidelbergense]|uniref:Uncharacterized protein n=1 Tax=Mycobacterium heidelbergense TaxID=53376 RepID=A0A1X0D873_MYCHE|nr:hypothetical protein BST25_21930 [Mycobacterium heidelbergense]
MADRAGLEVTAVGFTAMAVTAGMRVAEAPVMTVPPGMAVQAVTLACSVAAVTAAMERTALASRVPPAAMVALVEPGG